MKALIAFGFAAFVGSAVLAYRYVISDVRSRIGSLQEAEQLIEGLRRKVTDEGQCSSIFSGMFSAENGQVMIPNVEYSHFVQLVKRGEGEWQGRLKVKLHAQAKEQNVGLLRLKVDSQGRIESCQAAGQDPELGTCQADNSPDPYRAGGKANIVRAPHGTHASSGPEGKSLFAHKGIVKWLSSDSCGPVNVCEHGLWTTVAIKTCPAAAPKPNKNPDSGA